MSKVNSRLERIERSFGQLGWGKCPLCFGHPMAVVEVMHERDPNGPCCRKTGECDLVLDDDNRITDDLRCRLCGAVAEQCHIIELVSIRPKREGRRVCAV